jgi:ribosomal-protein-alanine N-acetyltransferase
MTVARKTFAVSRQAQPLRAMAMADLDAVMAVEVSAYSHPWSRGNFVDSLLAGYVAEVLVLANGTVCGYFVALAGVDELHLLNVTVAPEFQSAGLGRQLLQAVQQHGRDRGLASLFLEVRHSNQRARDLYRRLGFAEVGLRKGYYPGLPRREDAVVMRLPLLEAPR